MTIYSNGRHIVGILAQRDRIVAIATKHGWTLHTFPQLRNVLEARKSGRRVRMSFTVEETLEATRINGIKVKGSSRRMLDAIRTEFTR